MKEDKIENSGKEMKEEQGEVLEKAAKLSELGKEYVGVSESELTQEEEILRSKEATPEVKKELVEKLRFVDKVIMKPTDAGVSSGKGKKKGKGIAKTLQNDAVHKKIEKGETVHMPEKDKKSMEEREV